MPDTNWPLRPEWEQLNPPIWEDEAETLVIPSEPKRFNWKKIGLVLFMLTPIGWLYFLGVCVDGLCQASPLPVVRVVVTRPPYGNRDYVSH